VIKNIASDPATFVDKLVAFEQTYIPGRVDVTVFNPGQIGANQYLYLIEYKSGPGATVCEVSSKEIIIRSG
jgi:hypothetical protein